VNTQLPAIFGLAEEGAWLEAWAGVWLNSPTGWEYGWRRCDSSGGACVDIAGAGAWRYQLTGADVGKTLRVVVTAKNAAGNTSATSAPTSVVIP